MNTSIILVKNSNILKSLTQIISLLSILILVSSIGACSNRAENPEQACIDHFLEEFRMQPYDEREVKCEFHIRLHELNGVYFAVLNSHCADLAPFMIFDCDGNEFCFSSDRSCSESIWEANYLGIIGIEN